MKPHLEILRQRVERYRNEVATVGRVQEELLATRSRHAMEHVRQRLDALLKLNQEILRNMRESLSSAEAELARAEQDRRSLEA